MKSNIEKYFVEHLAIRALIDGYNDIVNNRNWEAIPQIFAINLFGELLHPLICSGKELRKLKSSYQKALNEWNF